MTQSYQPPEDDGLPSEDAAPSKGGADAGSKPSIGQAQTAEAARILSQLGPLASETRGLETLVRHAAAHSDAVLDERALFLGLLASGLEALSASSTARSGSERHGNAASWFVEWLSARLGPSIIEGRSVELQSGLPVASMRVAADLAGVFSRAVAFASLTVQRDRFDLRHLVAAMDVTGVLARQTSEVFGLALTGPDLADFEQAFIGRIENWHERGENPKAWIEVFSPPGQGGLPAAASTSNPNVEPASEPSPEAPSANPNVAPPIEPSPAPFLEAAIPPADRVTGFSPDQTDGKDDPLAIAGDVDALAKLICLEEVTPLSVAIFGGWGAGKTTFMNRLDARIRTLATRESQRRASAPPLAAGSRGYVQNVVPIWFNAWQFVDANLWASLTAELFDQLRSGGPEGASAKQHAALVEKVNQHVHALSDDAKSKREAAAKSAKAAEAARSARDDAARKLKRATDDTLGEEALQALGEAYRAEKPQLDALGLSTAEASAQTFLDVARDSASLPGQLRAVSRLAWRQRGGLLALAVAALVALAAIGAVALLWKASLGTLVAGGVALFTTVAALAGAIAPALRLVLSVASRGAGVAQAVQKADADAASAFLKQEEQFRELSADARKREAQADDASKALSIYAEPTNGSNPPRLLRYLLEDDPDTRALEKEVGLIGRTRRLFQALDYIMRHDADESLERIVIFIDDLDRCTEEQVYHALQATQLLLAFKSFVVVVGVDVDWVERTLASQIAGRAPPDDPDNRLKAVNYLEKIFQVAFWLAPLSGPDGGGYGAYVHGLADPPPTVKAPAKLAPIADAEVERDDVFEPKIQSLVAGAGAEDVKSLVDIRAPDIEITPEPSGAEPGETEAGDDDAPATLEVVQLDQRESDFLASDAIAGIAAQTPRSVKRLINVYRLVRARLEKSGADLLGDKPDYPLIAFFVALETGQTAPIANGVFEGLKALKDGDSVANLELKGRKKGRSARVAPPQALAVAADARPELGVALDAVLALRSGQLTAGEALEVARIARRYSFNRFQ
jgi:KAP family P-loop domain